MSGPRVGQASPARSGARLLVTDGDGLSSLEGVIVAGVRDEDGQWDLDGKFVLLTDEGERFTVNGWCCLIEREEEGGGEGKERGGGNAG